ncbi:MAG: LytTR family DNA-binding domain-containing protein [Rikenellaceae bacterium]
MRALIVEDESAAVLNLQSILRSLDPPIEVVALTESVVESVEFLREPPVPIDLIFMDIHLADGDAFKIFDRIEVAVPIIFTTAYYQYAIQAFKVNSIDYILKPIKSSEVERAINKLRGLTALERDEYNNSVKAVVVSSKQPARNFLVHVKDRIIPLSTESLAFIYTSQERVAAYDLAGQSYPLDKSLETIFSSLDPSDFFRANRQFIIARRAVCDVSVWFGSRLSLNLTCPTPEKIIIPKARTAEFKEWLRR